jgi:4-hydroxybenzoate polyprenyltransferase
MQRSLFGRIAVYMEMIKIAHTVFALPFAMMGMFLAAREIGRPHALPSLTTIGWIILAMVGARSAAMGFNRIVDADIDARNPRTQARAIPAGLIERRSAIRFTLLFSALYFVSAYRLNPAGSDDYLCLKWSPFLLGLLFSYSYMKRFTWACHLVLGVCLGAAPLAAWMAVTGTFDPRMLVFCFAVMFWVAGFDVFYALQDVDFDKAQGLHSIPRRLGIPGALRTARLFHLAMAILLLVGYHEFGLGNWYLAGCAVCSATLVYEHAIVKPSDLSRINVAFFNLNGVISIVLGICTYLDLAL